MKKKNPKDIKIMESKTLTPEVIDTTSLSSLLILTGRVSNKTFRSGVLYHFHTMFATWFILLGT